MTVGGEANSQDTTWMNDNVSSTRPRLSPSHTVSLQTTTYHADYHVPRTTIPAEAAHFSSW